MGERPEARPRSRMGETAGRRPVRSGPVCIWAEAKISLRAPSQSPELRTVPRGAAMEEGQCSRASVASEAVPATTEWCFCAAVEAEELVPCRLQVSNTLRFTHAREQKILVTYEATTALGGWRG